MMRPFITMQGQAKDALDFYQAVFPSFEMISLQHHSEPHENLIMLAVFSVDQQEIMISIVSSLTIGKLILAFLSSLI